VNDAFRRQILHTLGDLCAKNGKRLIDHRFKIQDSQSLTWYTNPVRSLEVNPAPPWFLSSLEALRKLWSLPPLTYSKMTNMGSRSVQHPKSRTTLGWGSRFFMTRNSCARSSRSRSVAFSFRVFTATIVAPDLPSISRASHFHTWPKQPSPRILKTWE